METSFRVLATLIEAVKRITRMRNREAALRALERLEKHAREVDADAIAQDEVSRITGDRDDG
jgi:uncharacterized protein YbjQ (UPF0145 family)